MTGRTLESAVVKLHEEIINPCKIKQPATFIAGARGVLSIMACTGRLSPKVVPLSGFV